MKKLSLRTGLLALLAFMTLLLLAVSVMGIIAINKGNRSLDVINRIQGIELNALYQSNGDLMRARATAAPISAFISVSFQAACASCASVT